MSDPQGWLLAALLAFSLGPLGVGLWLASSVLAVVPRKRFRLLAGGAAVLLLLASGWIPGLGLLRRLAARPQERVTAAELILLAYLNLGAVAGVAIVAFGRRRAPRPVPPSREEDLDLGKRLLDLHRRRCPRNPLLRLPSNEVYAVRERVWEVPVAVEHLPLAAELDGFAILHLSDIHLGGYLVPEYFEAVRRHALSLPHDVLVLTGDLLAPGGRAEEAAAWLRGFQAARPVLGVLGNHDLTDHAPGEVARAMEEAGVRLLGGQVEVVERGSGAVAFAGLDYQNWWRPFPVAELRARVPRGAFPVLVAHTPCVFPRAREVGFTLVLCGHTHGGQVRLPGVGALFIPARYGRRYQMGLYREGGSYLHVHPGIGGPPPLRIACAPEITRIVLRNPGTAP